LVTRFTRLHQGAQKGGAANLGSLSEPHHEQNPYANPKRTAKSQPVRNIRLAARKFVQTIFTFPGFGETSCFQGNSIENLL
jgi:hypothetical protein